jgi:hypothetical protein
MCHAHLDALVRSGCGHRESSRGRRVRSGDLFEGIGNFKDVQMSFEVYATRLGTVL